MFLSLQIGLNVVSVVCAIIGRISGPDPQSEKTESRYLKQLMVWSFLPLTLMFSLMPSVLLFIYFVFLALFYMPQANEIVFKHSTNLRPVLILLFCQCPRQSW